MKNKDYPTFSCYYTMEVRFGVHKCPVFALLNQQMALCYLEYLLVLLQGEFKWLGFVLGLQRTSTELLEYWSSISRKGFIRTHCGSFET